MCKKPIHNSTSYVLDHLGTMSLEKSTSHIQDSTNLTLQGIEKLFDRTNI